jgi:hypothetical protein
MGLLKVDFIIVVLIMNTTNEMQLYKLIYYF